MNSVSKKWTPVKWEITVVRLEVDIQVIVQRYKEYAVKERIRLEAERKKAADEAELRNRALTKILITSGYDFEGYKIKKYSGYISGEAAISINRGSTQGRHFDTDLNVSENLTKSLVIIRRRVIWALKRTAYDLGCNAVIDVDLDYMNLEPESVSGTGGALYQPYVFCVIVNGTAVVVEKDE